MLKKDPSFILQFIIIFKKENLSEKNFSTKQISQKKKTWVQNKNVYKVWKSNFVKQKSQRKTQTFCIMEAVKITKSLDYKLVITKGTRINSNSFNLQYLNSKTKSIRFGITASKRIGNAVRRNYAKRRIRALIHKLLLF